MGKDTVRRALLTLALLIGVIGPIAVATGGAFEGGDALWPLAWLAWAPAGYLIIQKRPGNGVGAALLFVGVTMGLSFATLAIAATEATLGLRVWAELVNVISGVVPWLGIVWLVLVYPSGRFATTWERLTGRGIVVFGIIACAAFTLSPEPMYETGVPSPLAVEGLGPATSIITGPGFFFVIALLLVAIVLLVRRWRSSQGIERMQFRWLFLGAIAFITVLTIGQFLPEDSNALYLWLPAGYAIPVTIGVAVLRYRLYEIDRILSRTISYALVLGLLGLIVLGLVGVMAVFLPSDDPLVVAAATLTVFALFSPVRKRVQRLVERRFNRSQYDAERVIDAFAGSLRDEIDPDDVVDGWVAVVSDTMEPATVGVWVRR